MNRYIRLLIPYVANKMLDGTCNDDCNKKYLIQKMNALLECILSQQPFCNQFIFSSILYSASYKKDEKLKLKSFRLQKCINHCIHQLLL